MYMKLTKQHLRTTDAYIKKLNKWGIETVEDFLHHFPKWLQDTSDVLDRFAYVNINEVNTLKVTFMSMTTQRTRNNKMLTKVLVSDVDNNMSECVYFRQVYALNQVKPWDDLVITGKPDYAYGKLSFKSPDVEIHKEDRQSFIPVYSDIHGVGSKWVTDKMRLVVSLAKELPNILPDELIQERWFLPRWVAIQKLHMPASIEEFEQVKHQLAYEELYHIQYDALHRKHVLQESSKGQGGGIPLNTDGMRSYIEWLPFSLTDHQKIATFQVLKDMERDVCMTRLLQGDVGTGKTIVAFLTMLHALQEGENVQVAMMAPTSILAQQLFENAKKFFVAHNIEPVLLVWATSAKDKKVIKENLKHGHIRIIIGTHALIQEDVAFKSLGYVVIDEQHRFWVEQRTHLISHLSSEWKRMPHVLMMTATPIPRTLSMTIYGDMDVSIIREYPAGRKPIITKIIEPNECESVYDFVQNEINRWGQVYWISPLVDESEKVDHISVKETTEVLSWVFPDVTIEMLHGRMKPAEKDEIMDRFIEGKTDILSSTSVVEVWVDNKNASIMCISDAHTFWLSALHQFRWRVGRWESQSYCYLFSDKANSERLRAMEKTTDGFELSEIDLQLRWPWEVYGVRQSWIPDLKLASLLDYDMLREVREDIDGYLEKQKWAQNKHDVHADKKWAADPK